MRVSIEHEEEKHGLFRKTTYYTVSLTVDFSEEEKQVIKDSDLGDSLILERPPQANIKDSTQGLEDIFHLRIKDLVKGKPDKHTWATPAEAKNYEADLKEVLPKLKEYIEQNSGIEEKSTTFEL